MSDINDPCFVWMAEEDFTRSNGIVQVYRDRWWVCHPETKSVLFVHVGLRKGKKANLEDASPQCNAQESVMQSIVPKTYPWAKIRFVPLLLKPINVRDYA